MVSGISYISIILSIRVIYLFKCFFRNRYRIVSHSLVFESSNILANKKRELVYVFVYCLFVINSGNNNLLDMVELEIILNIHM